MDANEHFEMVANEFYLDMGYLAPGKSESPVMWYEGRDHEREAAWRVWQKMRKQCASLRAEVSDATALAYNLDPDRTEPSEMELCEQINHLGEHIKTSFSCE